MSQKSLTRKFFPPEETIASLSIKEQEQLPLLVGSNLVFAIMFVLFGITLIIFDFPVIGGAALFLVAVFATSLYYIKHSHIHIGAWIITGAILVLTGVVCFGSPFKDTNLLPYRSACFIAVMAVCNYAVSLRRRQVYTFFIVSFLIWIADNLVNYPPLYATNFRSCFLNVVICSLGIITTSLLIILIDGFNRKVVDRAASNEKKSFAALEKISNVIEESKTGLNIGKQLSSSTDKANDSVREIKDLYAYLNQEADNLKNETDTVKESSVQINSQAEKMKDSVMDQSNSISQTSAALTQMSANLTNMSNIANKRLEGMDTIVQNLDSQMTLLRALVEKVDQVKESSSKISQFVETVNSIASQTGLLAMNASIEAAHAGTLGKGFSVIAQEIRKLSEETTRNAEHINETLQENGILVNETSESVTAFSNYTKTTTRELRETITAIEEILSGISEIDSGTQDVMNSLSTIVDEAATNSSLVENVASEITQQNIAMGKISEFAENLTQRVSSLDGMLDNIKNAISEINSNACANEIVAAKISSALN